MDALYFIDSSPNPNQVLCHHGIKGQKWGFRRYQNLDGSLTPEGRLRYGNSASDVKKSLNKYITEAKQAKKNLDNFDKKHPEITKMDDKKTFSIYGI